MPAEHARPNALPLQEHPFKGRTLAVVNDLTLKEQWFLYQKTRELKEAIKAGGDLADFRLRNQELAVYTIFMEDSTRTKESFRNAAEFHGMKVNVFDAKTSSFTKNETITDTVKMLCGYSIGQSIFVIRSKIEGVCRWLEEAITSYSASRGFPRASFINAGDGRHEHPSQEMLDEFSFLEHKGWTTDSIHLALLGDLFHGRTVHSKVDGLRLYDKVIVDLVAPAELALPKMYEDRMIAFGFTVRKFASIEEYLAQDQVAKIWYFTRLQLERMGEKVLQKSLELRRAVTFQREFVNMLPPGTRFFHPLPRDARYPTLPFWLDNTELNGWDQQSQNGYFTRIILLGMFGGLLGKDFRPEVESPLAALPDLNVHPTSPKPDERRQSFDARQSPVVAASDFIKEVAREDQAKDSSSDEVGLVPLKNGVIIENLAEGQTVEKIWGLMYMVRSILGLNNVGGQGVYRSPSNPDVARGFISVPDMDIGSWDRQPLKKLAAMAPGSTLKVVEDGHIFKEYRLQVPPRIYNFPDISCKNLACVSHPGNMQHEVKPYFRRVESKNGNGAAETWAFSCKYCEMLHDFWQIWDYKYHETTDFTI
mmetsp:Transcript_32090/g.92085  ORF Transcript_32090/g.92085 Transcript_32090/m.92085 type:complete len:592 (+) Transcript_32090:59-1834(+)|eukprot:CAMPEP_0168424254 /NCGR_PEP_ID=MMETSP0228-20121227/34729_1 /TAXON_ID=133427 /ORGANISM="Protoceratium reticulatum, Strain CCCM 535 (=CCMP 1889)" /LENGTH=591 /DNA_ID=CAMNT_0008438241 /DNA_START=38 /DNA_END=1813 /DNA_ORIENTATION=+